MDAEKPDPFVRVVVLDFNGGTLVVDAVRALTETQWPSDSLEIVCVDNGSTDGSIESIERDFPSVSILRNGRNLGFPGNNAAMRDLDGVDYLALVNSDAFVDPNWLAPLVSRAEADRGIGAVCPKILFADRFGELRVRCQSLDDQSGIQVRLRRLVLNGTDVFSRSHVANGGGRTSDREGIHEWLFDQSVIRFPITDNVESDSRAVVEFEVEATRNCLLTIEASEAVSRALDAGRRETIRVEVDLCPVDVLNNVGSWLDEHWIGHERGLFEADHGQFDASIEVGTWCGAAVLLRTAHLDDVGLFEEQFFLYYEDTDLAVRGRSRGWNFITEPLSVVRHVHSASTVEGSELAEFYIERNHLLMVARNAPLKTFVGEYVRHLLVTASYARASVLSAMKFRQLPDFLRARRRTRSFFAAVRLLPSSLRARRTLNARRLLSETELRRQLSAGMRESSSGGDTGSGVESET
jgi:GT2 family glycosyltransferase